MLSLRYHILYLHNVVCFIGTLPRLFLESTVKANFEETSALRKALGIPGRIFILVRVLLF